MPGRSHIVWPQGGPYAPLITTPSPLPSGLTGSSYSQQLTAVGGRPPYTWSKVSDSGSGLSLSPSGLLSGMPSSANTFALVITATDSLNVPSTPTGFLLVVGSTLAFLTPSPLPAATQGSFYSTTITASGGTPPYAYAITSKSPGTWESINASTGALSGTPPTVEIESLVLKVTDSATPTPASVSKTYGLTVQALGSVVFTPDTGYSYSGPVAFGSSGFIVAKTGGGFGATGPILSLFDDFRSGTAGASFGTGTVTPVLGDQVWTYPNSGHGTPAIWGSPNRSGSGQTMRVVSATDATFTPKQEEIVWSGGTQIQQFYAFWAENSYGADYRSLATNNGNSWNYKMLWLMYSGFSSQAFETFMPAFFYNPGGPAWNLSYGNNNPIISGGPLANSWYSTISQFDPASWNSFEVGFYANVANPTTVAGQIYFGLYNTANAGYQNSTSSSAYMSTSGGLVASGSGTNGPWSYANNLLFPGLIQGFPTGTVIDRADPYIAIGPNCFKRFAATDQSTLTASTKMMPFTIDTTTQGVAATGWTDGQVSMTPQPGPFASLVGCHLWWWDVNNAAHHSGVFSAITTFDYYVSTTGSDSNAGTLAAPWAITSFISSSSNQSKMAGKRIGLIAGTYNVAGTTGVAGATKIGHGSFPTNNSYCALTIPTGPNATTPTYVGSSDIFGKYSQRAATISVISGQVSSSTNVWYNGLIGSGEDYASHVYVTIDGITFNGAGGTVGGMDSIAAGNEGAHIVFFQTALGSFTSSAGAAPAAILVQNCHIFGIQATDNGGNDGGVFLQNVNGVIVTNNKLHDISKQASDASHCHASESYGCQNIQWTYNTIYNCTGGALEPKVGNTNCTAAYNYIYNSGNSGVGNSAVFQAWDGAEGNPNTPNVGFSIHHNIVDSCGRVTFGESNNANHSMQVQWYNNTIYNSGEVVLNSIDSAVMMHYNNVYVKITGTNYTNAVSATSSFVNPLAYDSFYNIPGGSYSGVTTGVTETTGLQTGQDPLFLPGTASITAGAGASQFQLQGGSPAAGSGFTGGTSAGAAINRGAWDGVITQIGCNFNKKNLAPGHWASFTRLSGGASNYSSIRGPQYSSDQSFGTSGLAGYIVTSVWADWEPGNAGTLGGDYTISAYLQDIQTCAANGKKIGFKILTYGSGSSPNGVIPNYMWNSSNALYPSSQLPCYYGANPTIATSLWRCLYNNPFVQQRAAALYNWLLNQVTFTVLGVNYTGFNSCPWVSILGLDEETQPSNISACISANGYGTRSGDGPYYYQATTWATGYEATIAAVGAYATSVQIKTPFNQLPQFTIPEAVQMANTIVNAQSTFGAPDLQPSNPGGTLAPGAVTYNNEVGVAAFLGTLSNLSALNNVPYIAEMEGDDMPGGSLYNGPTPTGSPAIQGCQWLFNFATNAAAPAGSPAYTASNLRATQIWWQILPSGNVGDPGPPIGSVWHTDVLPFINSHPFPNNYLPQGY